MWQDCKITSIYCVVNEGQVAEGVCVCVTEGVFVAVGVLVIVLVGVFEGVVVLVGVLVGVIDGVLVCVTDGVIVGVAIGHKSKLPLISSLTIFGIAVENLFLFNSNGPE